ncbi:hypothetical protein MKA39_25695, partial [[Clostridium] innocuum]|nr:hypothetical protein [[Clostridium] innocuum]
SHQKIQYILQNIQKKTISFRKLPIYNKKPMSLRKGIGFCQQSEQLSNAEIVATVRESLSSYRPKSVRRVLIPKAGSDKMRPLGIP